MDEVERHLLAELDAAVLGLAMDQELHDVAARVLAVLEAHPERGIAWESVPLGRFVYPLPPGIASCWVFVLRRGSTSGAERHPRSHQRMVSFLGSGVFQTRTDREWRSHPMVSDHNGPLKNRWISIPPMVWHQGVVDDEGHWVVVSFHTVPAHELVEERPAPAAGAAGPRRRVYESG